MYACQWCTNAHAVEVGLSKQILYVPWYLDLVKVHKWLNMHEKNPMLFQPHIFTIKAIIIKVYVVKYPSQTEQWATVALAEHVYVGRVVDNEWW